MRACALLLAGVLFQLNAISAVPTLEEAVSSLRDVWGDAALKESNGPTYEFFEKLLPPPRYVNADFKYYPIVLSAPNAKIKVRWISNGSGVNLRGGTRSWNDTAVSATFRAGPDELRFGEYPQRLVYEPYYASRYLPLVHVEYKHGENIYWQEAFAATEPELASNGVVFVQFVTTGTNGQVAINFDSSGDLEAHDGQLRNKAGVVAWFGPEWQWTRQRLVASLKPANNNQAVVAIASRPCDVRPTLKFFDHRRNAVSEWALLLQRGMQVEVPEDRVNNAWRALVCQNFALINGDRMHYSAGNQYDHLYEAEGCDAVEALLVWGYTNDVKRLIPAQLDFTRKGLEFHQAGHKLQLLCHYFHLTRDGAFIAEMKPRWERELNRILVSRTNSHGLFPKERYCGDVATPVYSLNSNAKCWRALRDFSAVLREIGNARPQLDQAAAEFRKRIVEAVAQSERRPFVPIALMGDESAYSPITGTKIGSYWNLMANYVLASEVFGPGSDRENGLVQYVEDHGGLCMGLIRSRPNPTFWTGPHSINPLYGLRRILTLLRRDEPDKVLVAFYGMLAQGMTRDTFVGAEGCSLTPLDDNGRLCYCPPNSASNGFFLWMLRCMLVQDWDLDDDGDIDTLRLMFATPRPWLEDGKAITVERAPTAFGEVSVNLESHLSQGEVSVRVSPPQRAPRKFWLRLRLPHGWILKSNDQGLAIDGETMDFSKVRKGVTLRCKVTNPSAAK